MIITTKVFGWTLVLLGLGGYLATGAASLTALIPAALGALVILAAAIGRKEPLRRHAMHAAVVLAALGFLGSVSGIVQTVQLLGGSAVERPGASIARAFMALLCAGYLILSVRSFFLARTAGGSR